MAMSLFLLSFLAAPALAQSVSDIKLVQEKLSDYGAGLVNGVMSEKTRAAIIAYQNDWQISETGRISAVLLAMLKRGHPRTKAQWFEVANRKGCKIWNAYPAPRETVTWTGSCKNGKPSGEGTLEWVWVFKGTGKRASYEGEVQHGFFHGQGVYTWADSSRYKGGWKNGEKHGRGLYTEPDGRSYEGGFKAGRRHGRGLHIWADGSRYEGQYVDGKRHGHGLWVGSDGSRYEGGWKHGEKHGQGVHVWADGARYEGAYRSGKPHGRGVYITPDGKREVREWHNGCSRSDDYHRWINTTQEACGF